MTPLSSGAIMVKKCMYGILGALILISCLVAGCIGADQAGTSETIVIGGKPFNEQYILPQMIALLLEDEGYRTDIRPGMNDATLFAGIKRGQVDIYVEYTGTAYSQLLQREPLETWDPDLVFAEVRSGMAEEGIHVPFRLGFRNDYAIAVKESYATENNIETISDLVPYADTLVFGSDLVFHEREDGLPRLAEVYGLSFADVRPMSPTLMYEAIDKNQVQAIPPYTTDSRVDLYNLVVLRDDQAALPPYEAMLFIRSDRMADVRLINALSVLENRIDTDEMRALNAEFDNDKREARDIARDYLIREGLISS
ncbi:glycine betaine ABC transporter substrate-binding protein [Methanocalculus chunghsingensis]|nr:glycine betaine ABC transporter substrate-binding protein [Methanocalculus chunghsingensis]